MNAPSPKSKWHRFLESDFFFDFKRSPLAMLATAIVAFLFVVAIGVSHRTNQSV